MNNYSDTELQDIAFKARKEPVALSYTRTDVKNILKHLPKPVDTEPTDAWEAISGHDLSDGDVYKFEGHSYTMEGTYFEGESCLFYHPYTGTIVTKDNIDAFMFRLYRKKVLPVEYGSVIKNVVLDSGEEVSAMVLSNIGWFGVRALGIITHSVDSDQIVSWEHV